MESVIEFVMQYGYAGMFVAAFVAGSVFPFSSEAVLAGLQLAGLREMPLFVSATIGNFLGRWTTDTKRLIRYDATMTAVSRCHYR